MILLANFGGWLGDRHVLKSVLELARRLEGSAILELALTQITCNNELADCPTDLVYQVCIATVLSQAGLAEREIIAF